MNKGTHTHFAGCCALAITAFHPVSLQIGSYSVMPMMAIPFAMGSAWFLDIDLKHSNARKAWRTYSSLACIPAGIVSMLLLLDYTGYLEIPLLASLFSVLVPVILATFLLTLMAWELKHRTFTHSLYIPFFFYGGMMLVATYVPFLAQPLNTLLFGLMVGTGSHLLSDACTKRGIWLAYPLPLSIRLLPKRFAVVTKKGSKSEKIFGTVTTLITALLCIYAVASKGGLL